MMDYIATREVLQDSRRDKGGKRITVLENNVLRCACIQL